MTDWKNGSSIINAPASRYQRSHSSLNGKTPAQVAAEKSAEAPFWEDVVAKYDPQKERIRE